MYQIKLPRTSDEDESVIVFWHKTEGDSIQKGDILVEVQTEKAVFEIEAENGGILKNILVNRGEVARVGDVLAVIEPVQDQEDKSDTENVQEKEVPIQTQTTESSEAHFRRTIAKRMMQSLQQSAQLTEMRWVDVTVLNGKRYETDPPLNWTDIIAYLTVKVLKNHPHLNAIWENDRIIVHPHVHLGIAVDTDKGLVVPVIKDADKKDLVELRQESRCLINKAKSGLLSREESSGGTFTLSNLGQYGIQFFTPIINPPETAILGIGKVESYLVLEEGQIKERYRLPISLTFDHRIIDGAPAARFLQTLTDLLNTPEQLI